ncbi:MAG: homocysteine S-methyltransferase family protein [bacterium]|nr:homocysteine S-methyltransferase family protein [bacterium]
MLADGAIETRVVYEFGRALGDAETFTLLRDADGRRILTEIYRSYARIAAAHALPMQLGTPTWHAARRSTDDVVALNREAVALVREAIAPLAIEAVVAGVMGPAGDGYDPSGALSLDEAHAYHREQAQALAAAGCDLLYVQTVPACDELHGAARACGETNLPFALAPMLRADGTMTDGTPLADAIARIDADALARPWHYMLGCIAPAHARRALEMLFRSAPHVAHRVIGIKANPSPLAPEELDAATRLERGDAETFARDVLDVAHTFGLHVVGGCCGTDTRDIEAIAALQPRVERQS